MRYLKYLALLTVLMVPLAYSQEQVSVGIGVGPGYMAGPPVCSYGYYDYYPYACAPYGYYGPDYFVDGVFIGVGPWYHWGHPGWFWNHGYAGRGWYGRPGWGYRGGYARGYEHGYNHGYVGRGYSGGSYNHGYARGEVRGGGGFHGNGGAFRGGQSFHGGGGGFHGGGSHGGGFHGGGGGHR
jgi:hypothetical protein